MGLWTTGQVGMKNSISTNIYFSFEIDIFKSSPVVKRAAQFPANFEEPE
jgi:hypothetical protein